MRLNRILQLAASFSILIFAMVFTITSCSGDDGKNGKNGADGKSCFADPMPDGSGYNLYCGGRTEDDFVGPIYHGVGEGGVAPGQAVCVFTTEQVSGSAYTIKCGETKIPIYGPSSPGGSVGGGCNVADQSDVYNKFWLKVTCGSTVMDVCLNGGTFDPATSICTNGLQRKVDINRVMYNYGGYYEAVASGSNLGLNNTGNNGFTTCPDLADGTGRTGIATCVGPSGVGTYSSSPANLPIRPGIVLSKSLFKCNTTTGSTSTSDADIYDPNTEFCQPKVDGVSGAYELKPLCGGNDYTNSQFCFKGKPNAAGKQKEKVVNKCGGNGVLSSGVEFTYKEFCQVSEQYTRTGSVSAATGTPTVSITYGTYAYGTKTDLCGGESVWWDAVDTYTNSTAVAAGRQSAAAGEISTSNDGVYNTTAGDGTTTVATNIERGIMLAKTPAGISGTVASLNFKGFGSATEGPIKYGKKTCSSTGEVLTQCALPEGTIALTDGNVALTYNAKTHFCRVNVSYDGSTDKQRVEVVPLCYSAQPSPTTGRLMGGTEYDGKDYGCNPANGQPAKKCADAFYDDISQFCFKEGATAIAVGNKCRVNPSDKTADPELASTYVDAQYDPRKQFCTIKIDEINGAGLNVPAGYGTNTLAGTSTSCAGKMVLLNGATSGGAVGASDWAVVGSTTALTPPITLNTPYATNWFPACYSDGDISSQSGLVSVDNYSFVEVPEDMCKGSIKYNQGSWMWQSCLVTDKTDRTKDLYQHCGEGERPKADFTGCEKLLARLYSISSYTIDWDGTTHVGTSVDVSNCTTVNTTAAGAVLGGTGSNECKCATGYEPDVASSSITQCGVYGHATVGSCEYSTNNIWPAYKGAGATVCEAANTCVAASGLSLGTGNSAKVCNCVSGYDWASTVCEVSGHSGCNYPELWDASASGGAACTTGGVSSCTNTTTTNTNGLCN